MHGVPAVVAFAFTVLLTAHAQGNAPQCVVSCITSAARAAGCSSITDWACMCKMSSFRSAADRCFASACSQDDAAIGQNMVDVGCSGQTSTSIHPPFSPPTTTTSLTVTNTETSPPQQSRPPGGPPRTSITLAPPLPPSSGQGPGPIPSATPAPPPSETGTLPSPTSSGAGLSSTLTGNSTTLLPTTFTTPIIPSGTVQSATTQAGTAGSAATRAGVNSALLSALFGVVGAWALV